MISHSIQRSFGTLPETDLTDPWRGHRLNRPARETRNVRCMVGFIHLCHDTVMRSDWGLNEMTIKRKRFVKGMWKNWMTEIRWGCDRRFLPICNGQNAKSASLWGGTGCIYGLITDPLHLPSRVSRQGREGSQALLACTGGMKNVKWDIIKNVQKVDHLSVGWMIDRMVGSCLDKRRVQCRWIRLSFFGRSWNGRSSCGSRIETKIVQSVWQGVV